jgi:multicomponent Na+:H+ antiporter subunit D
MLDAGTFGTITMFGFELNHVRVDKLSLIFGYIFYVAAALGLIFAWHNHDIVEQASALVYVGAAIGAIFAGDLITLFIYWELTALASVFIIWAGRTDKAYSAAMRYLVIQLMSGVLLAAGAVVRAAETGSIAFDKIGTDSPGGLLILAAFGIKCAFPLLHNWLQDAYPEATSTGTVFLSAITTKLAVYALARGYAGTEELIWIGATMTAFPIFFAVIENNLRRVLAYSLNNSLGFIVVGVGIGTPLALNGAISHAVAGILYMALLFMSLGAVLHRTGTTESSALGGLYKSMPWTAGFCMIGSASVAAFPLFSSFITKAMILSAAAEEGHLITFLVLLFASAGVIFHAGFKVPFFAFFARPQGPQKHVKEAPFNMLLAMGLTAALCIGIGIYPEPLFALLLFPVEYAAYTTYHVVNQLQLLLSAVLAFAVLLKMGVYPKVLRSTVLDFDFSYRWIGPRLLGWLADRTSIAWETIRENLYNMVQTFIGFAFRHHSSQGLLGRTQEIGQATGVVVALLAVFVLALLV